MLVGDDVVLFVITINGAGCAVVRFVVSTLLVDAVVLGIRLSPSLVVVVATFTVSLDGFVNENLKIDILLTILLKWSKVYLFSNFFFDS